MTPRARSPFAPLSTAFLALALLGLAGCADGTVSLGLAIDFAGRAPAIDTTVEADLSSRPTASDYQGEGFAHADGYTAHDQIAQWSQDSGTPVEAERFSGAFGSGYFLTSIAGVAADGTSAYWALSINGQPSDVGMSDLVLRDGDAVLWTYTPTGAGNGSSGDADPLGVTVDPPAPTQGETATVTGSVNQAARVSIDGGPAIDVEAGRWTLESGPLDFGRTAAVVRVQDDVHDVPVNVTFVRLAPVTIEVLYTMAVPPHSSTEHSIWVDVDAFASAPQYADKPRPHPGHANIHDALVTWSTQTGIAIEYSYDPSFDFGIVKIDGVGQPLSAEAPPYWCYKLNGESPDLGITLQPLMPGDVVTWEYAGCA